MKKICILLDSDLAHASRAQRTANNLAENYEVHLFCVTGNKVQVNNLLESCFTYTDITEPEHRVGKYFKPFKKLNKKLLELVLKTKIQFDFIYAHDLNTLQTGVALKKYFNAKLLYDVHDLTIETANQGFPVATFPKNVYYKLMLNVLRNSLANLERKLIHAADIVITVNKSLEAYLIKKYNLKNCNTVNNYPVYTQIPRDLELRKKLNIDKDAKIVIYHGCLGRGRHLNEIVQSAQHYDKNVFLVIIGNGMLYDELKEVSGKNVFFIDYVPYLEIFSYTSDADIGLIFLEHINYSKKHASANKLFEYMACSIPVLCSDSPELVKVLEDAECGYVLQEISPENIASQINTLLKDTSDLKQKGRNGRNAYENKYNWKIEGKSFLSFINSYLETENIVECRRCLYNNKVDPDITFNIDQICNHCLEYDKNAGNFSSFSLESEEIKKFVQQIKQSSKHPKYDCIIGVSGGVDSTYTLLKSVELGLTPLAVHLDNGWNSEIANENIKRVLEKLDVECITINADWEEFRDMQLAYLNASVLDIEVLSDQAIAAVLFKTAKKYKLKFIVTGENLKTEPILPKSWTYLKSDHRNIIDIHRKFGSMKMKNYPLISYFGYLKYQKLYGINYWRILDSISYNKNEAKTELVQKLGWKDYGGKHYESIFTRFYQTQILPEKFNIDKRFSHFSGLICSGNISKDEASEMIKQDICDHETMKEDKVYVLQKLGLSAKEFDKIMKTPVRSHYDFANIYQVLKKLKIFKFLSGIKRV